MKLLIQIILFQVFPILAFCQVTIKGNLKNGLIDETNGDTVFILSKQIKYTEINSIGTLQFGSDKKTGSNATLMLKNSTIKCKKLIVEKAIRKIIINGYSLIDCEVIEFAGTTNIVYRNPVFSHGSSLEIEFGVCLLPNGVTFDSKDKRSIELFFKRSK